MNVKKVATAGALLCLVLSVAGCGKSDRAMPLTKENVMAYREKLVGSRDEITMKDRQEAQKSLHGTRRLFAQTFVAPMEKLGYSYDMTVRSFAEKLEKGELASGDPETRTQVEGFILMAKSTADFAVKNGFISLETKKVLDRVHEK